MITDVRPCADPEFEIVAPGFVDLQVNGHDDVDVATADAAGWRRLGELLTAQGVTSWCPTLVSAPLDVLDRRLARVADHAASGADVVGVHLEGPFLGTQHGAHTNVAAGPVDLGWLAGLPETVAIVTLGPECEGAGAAIALLGSRGVVAALGHTAATAEHLEAAVDAGATLFTHVFNASGALHQREPGAVGAALTDDRLAVSLIADGHHLDARIVDLVFRAKPAGKVVLVSDAVGWRSGRLGEADIALVDGAPRLPDGTLAGSALTMDGAVRFCVHEAGIDLEHALRAASANPAAVVGLDDRGSITPGRRADLVALSPGLTVDRTWVGGQPAGSGS